MEVREKNNKEERQILIGFITSTPFLARTVPKFESELFQSRWSNLIAQWCVKFYNKYRKAPKDKIEAEFDKWCRKAKDEKTQKLVESFLSSLSREYDSLGDTINVDYLIDRAGEYFTRVKYSRLLTDLQESLDDDNITRCNDLITKYISPDMGEVEIINPYLSKEVHQIALASQGKPLFRLGGAIGKFFGDQLIQENFIAFQAPEKAGKSFWLQEIAHRGAMNALRVAYFGIGDMSRNQIISRFQARITKRPVKKCTYYYPLSLEKTDPNALIVLPRRTKRKTTAHITLGEIERARKKFARNLLPTGEDLFKMKCQPIMSVEEIRSILEQWKIREDWTPDIIVIDYADLLSAPAGVKDKLEKIDENWKQLRQFALTYHCLVMTATQVKRTAYNSGRVQNLDDTADQKTKAAHVTGLIGINCTSDEYDREARRLNWIVCRDGAPVKMVHIAGCFAVANPCILSTL